MHRLPRLARGRLRAVKNLPIPAILAAQDASDAVGLTQVPGDDRETRLRALYALFFHEAGLEVDDVTLCALAASTRRMGYVLVPVRR